MQAYGQVFCGEGRYSYKGAEWDYLSERRLNLIEAVADTLEQMRDASARGESQRYYQCEAELRRLVDEAGRNGWVLQLPRLMEYVDITRARTRAGIVFALSEWMAPPQASAGEQYPSSATHRKTTTIISDEVDERLAWLEAFATIEACTLLLTQLGGRGDPQMVAHLQQMRAGAENDLKRNGFQAHVAELAERIARENAPVVPTERAKAAVSFLQAKMQGAESATLLDRLYAFGLAFANEAAKFLPTSARKSAELAVWKAEQERQAGTLLAAIKHTRAQAGQAHPLAAHLKVIARG